jgi:hypothetical protein
VGDEYCEYACQPKAPSTTPTSTFFKRCRYSFKGNLTPKLSAARHGCRTAKALYLSDFTHLSSPKRPRACAAACC